MKENGFKKIFQGTENFVCTVKGIGWKYHALRTDVAVCAFISEIISNVTSYAQIKCVFHYTVFNQQMSD